MCPDDDVVSRVKIHLGGYGYLVRGTTVIRMSTSTSCGVDQLTHARFVQSMPETMRGCDATATSAPGVVTVTIASVGPTPRATLTVTNVVSFCLTLTTSELEYG